LHWEGLAVVRLILCPVDIYVLIPPPVLCRESKNSLSAAAMPGMEEGKGMVLPFMPLTLTFHNLSYYVDAPAVRPFPCFSPAGAQASSTHPFPIGHVPLEIPSF
jgi:hypothetical protein